MGIGILTIHLGPLFRKSVSTTAAVILGAVIVTVVVVLEVWMIQQFLQTAQQLGWVFPN